MSAYVHCACRDCFDIAMSSDENTPALCSECKEAGCVPAPDLSVPATTPTAPSYHYECQRADAYGVENDHDA